MKETLEDVRAQWERGLKPLTVIGSEKDGQVLVILKTLPGVRRSGLGNSDYHCHRYFSLGESWLCSVDGQNVPLEAVFSWLNDPNARTTQPENYVTPK